MRRILLAAVLLLLSSGGLLADDFSDGVAALRQKEYAEAIRLSTKAIEQEPNDVDALVLRGAAYQGQGELDKAIEDYNQAIRLFPEYVPALIGRGTAWHAKGELDRAFADFDLATRLEPNNYTAYQARGDAWSAKGELDKALADYNEAIRLDPFNASEARNHRAWIRATCWDGKYRDGAKAVEDATKACYWTYWKVPEYFDTLAAAYAEAGQFDKAIKWQDKAIALAPDDDDLKTRLKLYQAGTPYREEPEKK